MAGCRVKREWLEDAGFDASQKAVFEAGSAVIDGMGAAIRSEFRCDIASNVYEIEYASVA